MYSVRIDKMKDYDEAALAKIVSDVLDASGIEFSGKTVLVKPNLLAPFPPEAAVTTHPALVKAVRRELKSRGSEVMVGDNPGMEAYGSVVRAARECGVLEAAGDDFVNLSLRPRSVAANSRFTETVSVCSEVLEADLYVSLPKFKTHMLTVMTGGIKNSYGLLVGADKTRMHARAPTPAEFGEMIVDVHSIRPPDLTIMDAIVGMEGNGPSGGRPREIGCIISSKSAGALDLAVCSMMGVDPSRIHTQRVAAERGLAPNNLDDVEIQGELPVLDRFKTPVTLFHGLVPWRGAPLVLRSIYRPRIKVNRKLCTACRTCERGCPAKAITMDGYPAFDFEKCIACYCCYELCPENALKVGGFLNVMRRLL